MIVFRSFFLFVALFSITLQSYYFTQIGVAIFPVIGASLLCCVGILIGRGRLSGEKLYFTLSVVVFFLWYIVFAVFGYSDAKAIVAALLSIMAVVGLFLCFSSERELLFKILTGIVLVHLVFFFLQVFYWFIVGGYLDFLQPITGESQRYLSQKGLELGGARIPRFTGLFNEPGTYSNYLFAAVVLRSLIGHKYDFLYYFAGGTLAASFSLYGIFFFAFMLVLPVLSRRGVDAKLFLLLPMILVLSVYWVLPKVTERADSDYSGVEGRAGVIRAVFDSGVFFIGDVKGLTDEDFPYNDAGLPVAMIFHGGIVEFLLFSLVFCVAFSRSMPAVKAFLIVILATKIKYTYPFLWVVLVSAFMIKGWDKKELRYVAGVVGHR